MALFIIQVRPGIGAVKSANPYPSKQRRIEIPHVHANLTVRVWLQCFPVRHATAAAAAKGSYCSLSPNVFSRMFWMSDDADGCRRPLSPQGAIAAANRAIAFDERLRGIRNLDSNVAAMTSAGEHAVAQIANGYRR